MVYRGRGRRHDGYHSHPKNHSSTQNGGGGGSTGGFNHGRGSGGGHRGSRWGDGGGRPRDPNGPQNPRHQNYHNDQNNSGHNRSGNGHSSWDGYRRNGDGNGGNHGNRNNNPNNNRNHNNNNHRREGTGPFQSDWLLYHQLTHRDQELDPASVRYLVTMAAAMLNEAWRRYVEHQVPPAEIARILSIPVIATEILREAGTALLSAMVGPDAEGDVPMFGYTYQFAGGLNNADLTNPEVIAWNLMTGVERFPGS